MNELRSGQQRFEILDRQQRCFIERYPTRALLELRLAGRLLEFSFRCLAGELL